MGGFGSGNTHGCGGKKTTESQDRLDIRWLKKQGHLQPGYIDGISCSRGNEPPRIVLYKIEAERMILYHVYKPPGGSRGHYEQTIYFDRTPCNYGGYRTWFLCPRCSRRIGVLYCVRKYFLCRHCYDLTYSSQLEGRWDRLMRKARKIRRRLGASNNLLEPISYKPTHMQWKTFNRLRREAEQVNHRCFRIWAKKLGIRL